jgi:hypothetical protein
MQPGQSGVLAGLPPIHRTKPSFDPLFHLLPSIDNLDACCHISGLTLPLGRHFRRFETRGYGWKVKNGNQNRDATTAIQRALDPGLLACPSSI